MKHPNSVSSFLSRRGWTGWFGLTAIAACCSCRSPQRPPVAALPDGARPSQALVAELRGVGARAKYPSGSWHRMQSGVWLPMGSSVQTSAGSTVTLRLYDAGIPVEVKPQSLVRLEKLSCRSTPAGNVTFTLLELQKGEVAVDGSQLSPESEFEIRTPQGVTRLPPTGSK